MYSVSKVTQFKECCLEHVNACMCFKIYIFHFVCHHHLFLFTPVLALNLTILFSSFLRPPPILSQIQPLGALVYSVTGMNDSLTKKLP